ncbi:hypothetical protein AUC68_02360 [Methyloceanibacter methanicus]|uniref:Neuromedin U n=1 Tax=Methyloceanibacter methanicus TaxID=1774968 RepID=A0A1E3W2G8_9HYPH|nr:hypothetical protein [Methyloceanibacter methanicus]ODR99970.1 hypothetical protein AUC68_02360 [Methyloceanibacter methanicus]
MKHVWRAISILVLLSNPATALAQDAQAQANNPLANVTAVNLQNYYVGELTGPADDANQFVLRIAQPFSIDQSKWLLRLSAPVNSYPVGTNFGIDTGLGDINAFAAYLIDTGNPAVSFGVGPQVVAPTATEAGLGSDQWQLGFANVLFNASSSKLQYGYLLTYSNGVGDTGKNQRVQLGAFQPFAFYQLGDGWYTGGAPIWTYNFANDDYSFPLGLRLGKVIQRDGNVFNLFVEPQYSVADRGYGNPEWQVFFALNMQFGNKAP